MVKKVQKKDWDSVQSYVMDELDRRKNSDFRRKHEKIWKEVDRQVAMESLNRFARNGETEDWRAAIELGELSRASEIITADIRRLTFPQNRSWFDPHIQIDQEDARLQKRHDGRLRAFMSQQQIDFGFKSRLDLSVKEALHHGSYVATVEWEKSVLVKDGSGVSVISAPVWVPHSMWHCYPDPMTTAQSTFYQGSMIIQRFKPLYQVKKMVSENSSYPFFNINKIKEKDDEPIEMTYFYGDLVVPRSRDDLLLLNSRVILANGTIIHYMPNPNPFKNVIYNSWERLDVRDPYGVSPLVKFSGTQKIGSILASRMLDAVDLAVEPPGMYDGNDPDFMVNGGPRIEPGAMTPTKHGAQVQFMQTGDPAAALSGLQFAIGQIEAGTKVDRVRSGVSPNVEQTATEVVKQSQNAELSTVDFVDKHESLGLRPALYMQHDLNLRNLEDYKFYNHELDAPDFEIMNRSELPNSVHFEVVGSKGLLDEERRQAQTSQVTAFWMGANPQLLKQVDLAMEMFRDAGNKNPERFLAVSEEDQLRQQQFDQAMQQMQAEFQQALQEATQRMQQAEARYLQSEIDKDQKDVEKARKDVEIASLREQIKLIKQEYAMKGEADGIIADLKDAMTALIENAKAPKRVVFDEEGRPIGIESGFNA